MLLAVGEARNDLSRQLPEGSASVKAKATVRSAAAWFGGAYAIGDEALHLKPRFDVGIVSLRMAGFDEHGGEPLRLRVGAQSDTYAVLRPGIEMGDRSAATATCGSSCGGPIPVAGPTAIARDDGLDDCPSLKPS